MAKKPYLRSADTLRKEIKRIKSIEGTPQSSGKRFLLKILQGDKVNRGDSLLAKCCECMGYYVDGRYDCEVPLCPIYRYMPYREKIRPRGKE